MSICISYKLQKSRGNSDDRTVVEGDRSEGQSMLPVPDFTKSEHDQADSFQSPAVGM